MTKTDKRDTARGCALSNRSALGAAVLATLLVAGCGGSGDSGRTANGSSGTGTLAQASAFITDKLPIGLKDEPYEADIASPGLEHPLVIALTDGELPPGLELDQASGRIVGRPARIGEYSFVLAITNGEGSTEARSYSIFISESHGSESDAPGMAPSSDFSIKRRADTDPNAAPDLSNLLTAVAAMPEGSWQRVNLNNFSDVWTPDDLRPLYFKSNPKPSKIILAWSSFAWDSRRASLVLYGGGHANYRGNDVYLWRAETQSWERGSLPSDMVQDSLGNWNAVDGADKAPASAHTYDNGIYLPGLDRVLVLGGAADSNGGHYLTADTATSSRITGPYLFDTSKAHPDKVGGTTGSHVKRVAPYDEVIGGNMWSNRESWLNLAGSPPSESFSNACTGYANENGRDVVYLRTRHRIWRYELGALNDPASDNWSLAGRFYFAGSGAQAACAYDPTRQILLSANTSVKPFVAWSMASPGAGNRDVVISPTDPTGEFAGLLASGEVNLRNCGLDRDPVRDNYRLWCGDGRVWSITSPPTLTASGWTIAKAPAPVGAIPTEHVGTGIIGKWKYIPNLDVFMGLLDPVQGNIWIYKPVGWSNPAGGGNLPPSVSIDSPADGANVPAGSDVAISASALDGDGSVTMVEFLVDGTPIGADSTAPYSITWSNVPEGIWALTARATDNEGASRTSATVSLTVDSIAPPNVPPTVSLSNPADGASFTAGAAITLGATAADIDGTVVRVDFFDGATKLGEASAAPFELIWTNAAEGGHSLSAVAFDDQGAASDPSPAVSITVNPATGGGSTVTLQRDLSPGILVSDTYLSRWHRTLSFGASTGFVDQYTTYSPLLRFAIFQSEGGPVPDNAQISSAVLSIYKYSAYNMVYGLHRLLVDWSEGAATWNDTGAGGPWSSAGANAAGADYAITADATATTDFSPGWVDFDLTNGVQALGAAPGSNYGWRLKPVTGYVSGLKRFYTSEFSTAPNLRPKLVITYQ